MTIRRNWTHEADQVTVDLLGPIPQIALRFQIPSEDADHAFHLSLATAERLRRDIDAAIHRHTPNVEQK